MRFYYYYPTYNKPSGGNKQLRLQATLLRELGIETYLLRDEMYFNNQNPFDDNLFYDVAVETAPVPFERAATYLKPDDVLMLPEVLLAQSLSRCLDWNCRVAVNNQNGFHGIRHCPPSEICGRRIEFVIVNAPYVTDLCVRFYRVPNARIFLIPYWIDRPPFGLSSDEERTAEISIGYMPRKLPEVNQVVRSMVEVSYPDVKWIEIDGLSEAEVATLFRRLQIFFAAQDEEGFGMPAIEAMACGCLVTGFQGTGPFPHPYANAQNGIWAKDRDANDAADALIRAIELVRNKSAELSEYYSAAARTVAQYSHATAITALKELIGFVLDGKYDREGPPSVLGWRHEPAILRLLYNHDRLGWPGRVIDRVARLTKPLRTAIQRTGK